MALQQAQLEGLCLLYPNSIGAHQSLSQEMAASTLLRAIQLSQGTPFTWGYIDRPSDGQLFLIFVPPQMSIPTDGIRYLEQEQRYSIPVGGGRELEIAEVKFGFIPTQDSAAFRVRRRYRLIKGGHPQLVLIHYTRGQPIPIVPSLNHPIRAYPLRAPNEPPVYVVGEKAGQKVYPTGQVPHLERQASLPPGMSMNFGVGMGGNPAALLAQQNSNLEAIERRRERERSNAMHARQQVRVEEDDSADEADMISTRTLAQTRYRRNHEFMNEVFMHAAFGDLKNARAPKPLSSLFKKGDLEAKAAKLNAEIEELQAKATARREARAAEDLADISMDVYGSEGIIT